MLCFEPTECSFTTTNNYKTFYDLFFDDHNIFFSLNLIFFFRTSTFTLPGTLSAIDISASSQQCERVGIAATRSNSSNHYTQVIDLVTHLFKQQKRVPHNGKLEKVNWERLTSQLDLSKAYSTKVASTINHVITSVIAILFIILLSHQLDSQKI